MTWTVHNPRFEVKQYQDGWYWRLMNDGKGVAQSYGDADRNDTLDFIRWLKSSGAAVPIIGSRRP